MANILSLAATTYGAVSSTIGVVAHPIRSAQSAIRDYLVKKAVAAVVEIAGAAVAQELVSRVQVEKRLSLEVAVHRKARSLLLSPDTLALVQGMVNDGLAAPLAAVGLRLGALSLAANEAGTCLTIEGVFKLESNSEPPQLLAPGKKPGGAP